MNRRFRQAFTALREHGCVSYAKVVTVGGFCNVDLILVKATPPDDFPLPDKYVHELLKLFSVSPTYSKAFSISFNRRFGKTRCWRVALKCLLLLHRLLRSFPEDSPFRSEMLSNLSNGLICLFPCRFQDDSSSNPECYTTFIRSYAHLLHEALCNLSYCGVLVYKEDFEGYNKRDEIAIMLETLPQLQSLIDRVMDCRPTGPAARSFLIKLCMKYIIRDSFVCYSKFRQDIVLVLDNLFQMPYRSCIAAFGIYKKEALQANQLCEFYDWCRQMGFCGFYEYPLVDRIPQIQIQALESFINGMWQLTSPSPSPTPSASPSPSSSSSKSSFRGNDKKEYQKKCGFDGDLEMEPLIKGDDKKENDSWENLLEASVNVSGLEGNSLVSHTKGSDEWKIQLYHSSGSNPFYHQPSSMRSSHVQYPGSDPNYPWGL